MLNVRFSSDRRRERAEVRTFAETRTDHDAATTVTNDPATGRPVVVPPDYSQLAAQRFGDVDRLFGIGRFAVAGTTADGKRIVALMPELFDASATERHWRERGLADVELHDLAEPAPVGAHRPPNIVDPDMLQPPGLNIAPAVFAERRPVGGALSPERRRAILGALPLGRQVLEAEAKRQRGE
jgi:hypothetical protein